MPLAQTTSGVPGFMWGLSVSSIARRCCAGEVSRIASAPELARAMSSVDSMSLVSFAPGRKRVFSRVFKMLSTTSGSRAQSETLAPAPAATAASAVPQAPAPITATWP